MGITGNGFGGINGTANGFGRTNWEPLWVVTVIPPLLADEVTTFELVLSLTLVLVLKLVLLLLLLYWLLTSIVTSYFGLLFPSSGEVVEDSGLESSKEFY